MLEACGRDLYLLRSTPSGISHITCHRVWNAERFLAAMQADAKRNAEKNPDTEPVTISVSNREEYMRRIKK